MFSSKRKVRSELSSSGARIAIVAARYNQVWVDRMLLVVKKTLARAGLKDPLTIRVPGSFEVPGVVARLARTKKYDAIIALGIILQGKTSHADHVAWASTVHLQQISVETGVPVIHQILTPQNKEDALKRLKLRGEEAALAALEMVCVVRQLRKIR
jgi:6,7-dimethyl-8-ribityllumazine synthase